MKKYIKLLKILPVVFLVIVLAVFVLGKTGKRINNDSVQLQNLETILTINNTSDSSPKDISEYVGKTALEATRLILNGAVETKGEGINAYVTKIAEKEADNKKNEYWEFIVNGKAAEVGAGSYVIKPGDKIIWQINTF